MCPYTRMDTHIIQLGLQKILSLISIISYFKISYYGGHIYLIFFSSLPIIYPIKTTKMEYLLRLTEGERSAFQTGFCLHRAWLHSSSKFNHKSQALEQSLCYNEFFLLCRGIFSTFHSLDSSLLSSETACAFILYG